MSRKPEQLVARLRRRSGSPGYALVRVSGPVAEGDWLNVGRRSYVAWREGEPQPGNDDPVRACPVTDYGTPESAGEYLTNLVAAVNRDPLGQAWATRRSESEVLLVGRGVSRWLTVASGFAAPENQLVARRLDAATEHFFGRRGVSSRPGCLVGHTRTVSAEEAAAGLVAVALRRWPQGYLVQLRTASGVVVSEDVSVTAVGRAVVVTRKGAETLKEGMILTVVAW